MKPTKVLMVVLGVTALSLGMISVGMGRNLKDQMSAEAWIGLGIAPVALDLRGKNPELVGLGSYLVNAQGGCNDCHNDGTQYLPGGNPFLGQPKQINTAGYLHGGAVVFGVIAPPILPELSPGTNPPLPAGRTSISNSSKRCATGSTPTTGTSSRTCPCPVSRTSPSRPPRHLRVPVGPAGDHAPGLISAGGIHRRRDDEREAGTRVDSRDPASARPSSGG